MLVSLSTEELVLYVYLAQDTFDWHSATRDAAMLTAFSVLIWGHSDCRCQMQCFCAKSHNTVLHMKDRNADFREDVIFPSSTTTMPSY